MSNSLGLENLRIDDAAKDGKAGEESKPEPEASAITPSEFEGVAEKAVEQAEGDKPAEGTDGERAEDEKEKSEGKEKKERKTPYVNPDRVKTGGAQRDKLSEDELAQRMLRIREQNEKIKQRRVDVKADEDAFRKTQEAERAKLAKTRKVQEQIDRTREQNAQRKMDKVQSREWDSGKKVPLTPANGDTTKTVTEWDSKASTSPARGRGGGRGRGRGDGGRGRGRGGTQTGTAQKDTPSGTSSTPATPTSETPAAPAPEPVAAS